MPLAPRLFEVRDVRDGYGITREERGDLDGRGAVRSDGITNGQDDNNNGQDEENDAGHSVTASHPRNSKSQAPNSRETLKVYEVFDLRISTFHSSFVIRISSFHDPSGPRMEPTMHGF